MTALAGIFIILHGLVHLWYVVLGFGWVAYQPEMGWRGGSWLLSAFIPPATLRSIAGVLFILAALAFVISGVGIFLQAGWLEDFILGAALFSSLLLLIFWDGKADLLVQKGLIGLIINLAVIALVWIRR